MRPGAVAHGFNKSQRYVGCAITGATATTLSATALLDGNVLPPGYHLLFLVDHDRSPSLGAWIRLTEPEQGAASAPPGPGRMLT